MRLYGSYRCFISDHFQIVRLVLAACISILHVNLQKGKCFLINVPVPRTSQIVFFKNLISVYF